MFWPPIFWGGAPPNFWSQFIKLTQVPIMWRSFVVIDRGSSEITRCKKEKHHEQNRRPHGRPSNYFVSPYSCIIDYRLFLSIRRRGPYLALSTHNVTASMSSGDLLSSLISVPRKTIANGTGQSAQQIRISLSKISSSLIRGSRFSHTSNTLCLKKIGHAYYAS